MRSKNTHPKDKLETQSRLLQCSSKFDWKYHSYFKDYLLRNFKSFVGVHLLKCANETTETKKNRKAETVVSFVIIT